MSFPLLYKGWLAQQAAITPDKIAVETPLTNLSYSSFYDCCLERAVYFKQAGIIKGMHTGILYSHGLEFWLIVNSLWMLGAVPVPLNTRSTVSEINYNLSTAGIKLMIIDPGLVQGYKGAVFICDTFSSDNKLLTRNPGSSNEEVLIEENFAPDTSALILFTSGSSGRPKAVVHTAGSLTGNFININTAFALSPEDIWLASLPLYHIGGFMIPVRALLSGAKVSFPASLQHEEIRKSLDKFRPTHISLVPTTLSKLLIDKSVPTPNLKYLFLGGGPSDDDLCLEAVRKSWPVVKVYGSTETCSMVSALRPEELLLKPGSSGRPFDSNTIEIERTDENGLIGEIMVKGPSLFKEYYDDPWATADKIKNGWYHTGDYGRLDSEGYLFVESRREDVIITGGENVSASEVESVIKSLPGISDAFVFSLTDPVWGEAVCAAAVTAKREKAIIEALKTLLAGYKIPKKVFIVGSIPRNEMGKVIREKLFRSLNLS